MKTGAFDISTSIDTPILKCYANSFFFFQKACERNTWSRRQNEKALSENEILNDRIYFESPASIELRERVDLDRVF